MVFYRTYRPQIIADLDSESLRSNLTALLSGKEIPHAFLFTGPKGLGKTSTARIVAKVINCERKNQELGIKNNGKNRDQSHNSKFSIQNSENIEPCNKCEQCVSITNGTNLDVLEIDAASNRGIDEMRELRDKIRFSPVSAAKKVYIIDEVHMLTTEAFNALLKTLEEPPDHVVFILCTTDLQKVPATIVSRCMRVGFLLATPEELARSFARIAKGEKLQIDEDAVMAIVKLSDGSFRDGAKVLEEVSLLARGKTITKKLIETAYKTTNFALQIDLFLESLIKKDAKRSLEIIESMVTEGVDFKYFIVQVINSFHQLLLEIVTPETGKKDSPLSLSEISQIVTLLSKAYSEMKYAVVPQLPIEIAAVEWSTIGSTGVVEKQPPRVENDDKKMVESLTSHEKIPPSGKNDVFWKELVEIVKKENQSVAGILRGAYLSRYDGKDIVIETAYKFHKERLEEKKTREVIQKAIMSLTGKDVAIAIQLK